MRKYSRVLLYTVLGGVGLMLYLTAMTISNNVEQEIHRSGRLINTKIEETEGIEEDVAEREEKPKNQVEEETQQALREAESENNRRIEKIEATCKKYNLGLFRHSVEKTIKHPPVPQYSVFYFDKSNRWSFCPIYKAGSSTWLYNLCLLGGMTEKEIKDSNKQLSVLARSKYPELDPASAEEALHNTIKVLTVRHPFERLLSAYRDKLENTNYGQEHGTIHFYRSFGSKIVKKYRQGGNQTKSWELLKPSQYLWNLDHPKPAGIEPTFREFVQYLINLDLASYADDHWIPYYLYCTPCLLHYDVITKVETLERDQMYVIRVLSLQDKIKPRWQHKTQFGEGGELKSVDPDSVSSLAKVYFQQLSVKEIEQLYEKYKIDFELFDYDHSAYFQYGNDFNQENEV